MRYRAKDSARAIRESDIKTIGVHAVFGEMTWVRDCPRLREVEWRARYAEALTAEDRMLLASIASCYAALLSKPRAVRDAIVARLREVEEQDPVKGDS